VTTQVSDAPTFTSAKEALGMLRAAMGYLSAADATAMAAETQAQCLQALEQVNSMGTAARSSILAAFTSAQGYTADADYSPRSWLIHQTRVTKGAAVAYTAWVRRAAAHPQIAAVLAEGGISESFARTICGWTDKLPEDCRPAADAILVMAAQAGADLRGLAELAAEIYTRSRPEDPDRGKDQAFEDRSVKLETTFGGAGVLTGDLTPECATVVRAVLDALSAPAGAEDTRTYAQRYHDALQEAMRRLVAADLLPERAGQPVKVVAHISLADLMILEGSSALQEEWTARVRAARRGYHAGLGSPGAGGHRQGGRLGLRSGRSGLVPAAPAAGGPAGRPEPAAGRRSEQGHSGRDPARRHPARPALPVDRRLRPARRRLRSPSPHPQGRRRQDQRSRLYSILHLPPPGGHPPDGLDRRPEPRRHHHRLEPRQNQNPPQPQPASRHRVTPPGAHEG